MLIPIRIGFRFRILFRIRIHNVCNIIIAVIILWLSTPAAAASAAGGKWLFIMHAARVPTL